MNRSLAGLVIVLALAALGGCKTAGGAAIGAGIGELAADDPKSGALIGGGVGAVMDAMD